VNNRDTGKTKRAISYLESQYLKQEDLPMPEFLLRSLDKIQDTAPHAMLSDLVALEWVRVLAAELPPGSPERYEINRQINITYNRLVPQHILYPS
jgi:hypothetical protein